MLSRRRAEVNTENRSRGAFLFAPEFLQQTDPKKLAANPIFVRSLRQWRAGSITIGAQRTT
jgi:hypothetical protein